MYIKSTLDQQIEQVSTFRISSFKTVSDLLHNHIHHYHQSLTLPILSNRSPFTIQLHNYSPLIVVIAIDRKLIVLNLEYFSPFNPQ